MGSFYSILKNSNKSNFGKLIFQQEPHFNKIFQGHQIYCLNVFQFQSIIFLSALPENVE